MLVCKLTYGPILSFLLPPSPTGAAVLKRFVLYIAWGQAGGFRRHLISPPTLGLLGPLPAISLAQIQWKKRGRRAGGGGERICFMPLSPDPPPPIANLTPFPTQFCPRSAPPLPVPPPALTYLLQWAASSPTMHAGRLQPSHQHFGSLLVSVALEHALQQPVLVEC